MRAISSTILMLLLSGILFPQTEADTDASTLRLTAKITEQKYCSSGYSDMAMLRLSLRLTYTNIGQQPLILYRGSNLIHYVLVGSDERNLRNKHYEVDMHVGRITSAIKLIEGAEPGKEFVVLNPNESYQTEGDVSIPIDLDGTTKFLTSGEHVLQGITETWPTDEAQFDKLKRKWNDTGLLWGENVKSEPMPFSVEKRPAIVECK